ncbi:uncharacterized protein LOC118747933 [Rhagoletis pomonella]|uniref:uncharacterized protein LOC118747933 n=1 Tax=Rhagoletis pomonella TaxID=28610 RepID=UPI00177BDABC|nr:uncharacterized protein LOC118747933 [Rhagoletis pomonella]
MIEKKWTLDVESNRYDLIPGKFYLIGYVKDVENGENHVDIRLKTQSVDAKHCILDVSGDALYIYDLHSKLGTFLNGKRLDSKLKQCITVSTQLRFGEVEGQIYPKETVKVRLYNYK